MNVAIIPARGGSKRIPRKNIRPFYGKPIIQYSIEAAKESELFEHVVVSTDDDEIAQIALELGAGLLWRDESLTIDSVGTQEVTADAIRRTPREFEHACCIYATAPLMSVSDLRYSFELFITSRYRYVYVNGWYYWGNAEDFCRSPELGLQSLELDRIVGARHIDINTEDDWKRAEQMYAAMHA